jgi:twitching motility protein PilT
MGNTVVAACEVLNNTAAVRENIRDMTKSLNIPDLMKDGTVHYGMQSFDQSLIQSHTQGVSSYERALFSSRSPSTFARRIQGSAGTSDTSWDGVGAGESHG